MKGHSIGPTIMLQLGSFQFGLSTAAYQDLTRRSGYRWASQDRFGQDPALQFTGPESEAMTLSGTIYAEFRGGVGQLNDMRSLASKGLPQLLIDGNGKLLGRWVIESVEEKQSVFASKGYPRKQEFNLQLKKFPEPLPVKIVSNLIPEWDVEWASDKRKRLEGQSPLGKFVEGAASTVSKSIASMTSTIAAVKAKATEIGNAVGPVIATVQQGIATARTLQAAVADVKGSLGNLTSLENIQSAAYGIMGAASAASNAGAFAAGALKTIGFTLPDVPSVPGVSTAVGALKDCQVACGKMATEATSIYSEADKIRSTALSLVGK